MEQRRINVLLMPTDSCNLHCKYCFHECFHESYGRMSKKTLDRIYDITCGKVEVVQFVWHGGEPLLMGLDFFNYAFAKQKQYSKARIRNTMQSNITLMTDELAEFLVSNHVGIGTSFDGVMNEDLRGYSEEILSGRQKIIDHGGKCGVIMVLSSRNISSLIASYEYFKKMNINYSMNLYVSRGDIFDKGFELDKVTTVQYLKDFFDTWINDSDCSIHVDFFERIIRYIASGEKTVCKYTSCIGKWVGIRFDGTIVPCNRYFSDEYSYGSIWDYDSIFDAFESPGAIKLISESIQRRKKCQNCDAYGICEGGCNNVAYNETGIENNGGSTCVIFHSIYN